MSSRRKLWVTHDVDIQKVPGQALGLTFKDVGTSGNLLHCDIVINTNCYLSIYCSKYFEYKAGPCYWLVNFVDPWTWSLYKLNDIHYFLQWLSWYVNGHYLYLYVDITHHKHIVKMRVHIYLDAVFVFAGVCVGSLWGAGTGGLYHPEYSRSKVRCQKGQSDTLSK